MMIKKRLAYQWYLHDSRGLPAIVLHHPEMYLWIALNHDQRKVSVIGIYDTDRMVGYVVRLHEPHDVYYGETRPLKMIGDDSYKAADSHGFRWMDVLDKQRMKSLMRRAISFRSQPLPPDFKEIWQQAVAIVKQLDIIRPGHPRYRY